MRKNMILNRIIALSFILIFLLYGYTAFFTMDQLLPPVLKVNPVWPSTFPKILSCSGIFIALLVLLNVEKSSDHVSNEINKNKLKDYKFGQAALLIGNMIFYALTLRTLGFLLATFLFISFGVTVLGERRYILIAAVSLITSISICYLINVVLDIYMTPYPLWITQLLDKG